MQRLHEVRSSQVSEATEQGSKARMIHIPNFKVLPVPVVFPVPNHCARFYSSSQAILRPLARVPETSRLLLQSSDTPLPKSSQSQPDHRTPPSDAHCLEDSNLCQSSTQALVVRPPLDPYWNPRLEQCPSAGVSIDMLLDTGSHDMGPRAWIESAGRAPAVELEKASGTTDISTEDFHSSFDPVVSFGDSYEYQDGDAQKCVEPARITDTDEVTSGQ